MWQTQHPVYTIIFLASHTFILYQYTIAIVLVLYNAGPLDVSWAVSSDKVVAILESFFPAQVLSMHA